VPHTVGKLSTRAITLIWTSSHSEVCTQSYGPPKLQKSQFPNLGVLGQNDIWVLASWPNTENTIRGKVVASRKSGPWWILWICVCSWLVCAPRVLQLCTTNFLFGLCKSIWIIDLLVTWPSPHPGDLACPSTSKCYKPGNVPQFFILPLFSFLDSQFSPSRNLEVCHQDCSSYADYCSNHLNYPILFLNVNVF
jgi:hypothetical protein